MHSVEKGNVDFVNEKVKKKKPRTHTHTKSSLVTCEHKNAPVFLIMYQKEESNWVCKCESILGFKTQSIFVKTFLHSSAVVFSEKQHKARRGNLKESCRMKKRSVK